MDISPVEGLGHRIVPAVKAVVVQFVFGIMPLAKSGTIQSEADSEHAVPGRQCTQVPGPPWTPFTLLAMFGLSDSQHMKRMARLPGPYASFGQ